jgi:outer membrane protein with beta-barrel domain
VRRCSVLGCMVATLTLGVVQPVAAQNKAAELSVGYSFLANDELAVNEKKLPWGFFFDAALELDDWIWLAGELDGHFNRGIQPSASLDRVVLPLPTEDFQAFSFNRPETGFCSPGIQDCRVNTQTISAVAGPRFHLPAGRVRPFVHVMAGATRSARKIDFFAHTSTNFTIQPGGGVDVDVSKAMALRIVGEYRRVFFGVPDQTNPGASLVSKDGADYQDVIFSVGVVFKLGGRQ